MTILQIILMLLQAAPEIVSAAKGIDGAIHGTKKGPSKKAVLMAAFADAPPLAQAAASAFIDTTVSALKTSGQLPTHPVAADAA